MTRLYLQGRTETVRSLTIEAKEFVRAFVDETVAPEEKYRLLLKAAELHAKMYKDCMNGKGIDRHLFALFVVCRGQGYVSRDFFLFELFFYFFILLCETTYKEHTYISTVRPTYISYTPMCKPFIRHQMKSGQTKIPYIIGTIYYFSYTNHQF